MSVVRQFHLMDIPLPNQESSTILTKVLSPERRQEVLNRIEMENLYSEEELEILKEIKAVLEDPEEYKLLAELIDEKD